jgi:hypothetical protein
MMAKSKKNQGEKILNYTLRNLQINEICPNFVDGVVISIEGGKRRLDLPSSMSSDVFRKWLGGRGGVFSQDVSHFLKKKPSAKYILMEGEGERTILRLIDDDEFLAFETRKLVDGKVKDKAYMVLRNIKENEPLTTSSRYIIETPEIIEPEPLDIPPQDDGDSLVQSMQLFTD